MDIITQYRKGMFETSKDKETKIHQYLKELNNIMKINYGDLTNLQSSMQFLTVMDILQHKMRKVCIKIQEFYNNHHKEIVTYPYLLDEEHYTKP